MSDDIYTILLSQGFLNRECDLIEKKRIRNKQKNRYKVMKKILYDDISSDSEDYTATANQVDNNNYVDSIIQPKNNNYIEFLKKKI